MKKYVLYPLLGILGLILSGALILFLVLFFAPNTIINPTSLDFVFSRTNIIKDWSWKDAGFNIDWVKWNERQFEGYFHHFCFEYETEGTDISTCFEKFSWNFNLIYTFSDGFEVKAAEPVTIRSEKTKISLKDIPKEGTEAATDPPDILNYWKTIWSDAIPPIDFKFKEIIVATEEDEHTLNLFIEKDNKRLEADVLGFILSGDPDSLTLSVPKDYALPEQLGLGRPIRFRDLKLSAQVRESGIGLNLSGGLEALSIEANSFIKLPLSDDFTSVAFRKQFFLSTTAKFRLPSVKENLRKYAPEPLNVLPAPLNVMDGFIELSLVTEDVGEPRAIMIKGATDINLKGTQQVLKMTVKSDIELDVMDFSRGPIVIGLDFQKVALKMPRLSRTKRPPQFFPDGRIKKKPDSPPEVSRQAEEERPLIFKIEATGPKALHIMSNLLDEPLRLNMDLLIRNGNLYEGYIDILALKATVFKRPIHLQNMRIKFNHPIEPVIDGTIIFPLPEYKITLTLEGPISNPRHALTSKPPLPQNDIYAVLLFGRPSSDLGLVDSAAARRTSEIMSKGFLSLSLLYFFSGTPVEYVGYDPETGGAAAQIGLGRKSSVRVGRGESGIRSTSIRRSLGRGWYLDSSVQDASGTNTTQRERSYGLLLERIIAY